MNKPDIRKALPHIIQYYWKWLEEEPSYNPFLATFETLIRTYEEIEQDGKYFLDHNYSEDAQRIIRMNIEKYKDAQVERILLLDE